jgi:hypothetical protein
MVRMPAGHLPSPPIEAARLFPEPAAGEPYTILIMGVSFFLGGKKCHNIRQLTSADVRYESGHFLPPR